MYQVYLSALLVGQNPSAILTSKTAHTSSEGSGSGPGRQEALNVITAFKSCVHQRVLRLSNSPQLETVLLAAPSLASGPGGVTARGKYRFPHLHQLVFTSLVSG